MAQDIRKLFQEEPKVGNQKMPQGHEARFLEKLDKELPKQNSRPLFSFLNIAASVIILLGLSFGAYKYFTQPLEEEILPAEVVKTSPLGEISPELKKVEDYYLANINLELSKMKVTPENKEMFDGYLSQLEELNNEYNVLSNELSTSGPTERTINALIDNLKFRLNLMYRLKEKLNELNNEPNELEGTQV